MLEIHPLRNPIQHYDWGSLTAIPEFLGRTVSDRPVAEVWLGAHPKAPSEVRIGETWDELNQVLRRDPLRWLGIETGADEARLPFLLKILAAGKPLSIQAHPDRRQAQAGFEREDAAGVPRWDAKRNYRDRHHKPEIIYAVSPFTILCGFRPLEETRRLFEAFGLQGIPPLQALADRQGDDRHGETSGDDGERLRDFFARLLLADASTVETWVDQALQRADAMADGDDGHGFVARWLRHMAAEFPADRGVLAPLFLNLETLKPGQAVYTGPGVLHAYLDGLGIELMANSDNVLRGACTSKHIDRDELLAILDPIPRRPCFVDARRSPGVERFLTPSGELGLSKIQVTPEQPFLCPARSPHRPQILLCTAGEGRVRIENGASIPFHRDTSFVVPAATGAYRLEGQGLFFLAEAEP